ncbi:MAG TPA: hypothetical protein DEF35_22725 [Paenibacillus sp.]|uniref:hypothetical protein n=1 Tax=Paenibacillus TaxID=44249 RepID=UPI000BA16A42|nr:MULTISPECIES: hypothetical protein [Paenibacillus]OZQ65969.1 hypothetical protein CA599_19455 [Paenibacillus taichungensis]HBU84431.1 hypothetical protein [Paenibacillus sp.]
MMGVKSYSRIAAKSICKSLIQDPILDKNSIRPGAEFRIYSGGPPWIMNDNFRILLDLIQQAISLLAL